MGSGVSAVGEMPGMVLSIRLSVPLSKLRCIMDGSGELSLPSGGGGGGQSGMSPMGGVYNSNTLHG
jgi:hypothetical protein